MIVDDEAYARKGIISLFPWGKYGMQVAGEAASGEKALEWMERHPIDILFTDLTMPGMSGLELMREASRRHADLKSVVLTCHQDFGYIQEALRLGAIDYIVKTQLEMDKVDAMLERIVRRFRQERRSAALWPGGQSAPAEAPGELPASDGRARYSDEVVQAVMHAVQYIRDHLFEGITQEEVARAANMSRGYFSLCFRDIVGQSFGHYVKRLKVEAAKELLLKTTMPVYAVADRLGFLDEKYFSKQFRELVGMTPSEYRRQELRGPQS
jgi:YesN/AraC family two-component response regulator